MLKQVTKNEKIFQFDYGSDSDEDQNLETERRPHDSFPNQNPEKENTSPQMEELQVVNLERQSKTQRPFQPTERSRYQPLRRNMSVKVKKVQEDMQKIKPNFNKSVSKFVNIFQEAQQLELRTSGRFAVHEQNLKDEKMSLDATVSSSFSNSMQMDIIKKTRQAPVLKISNFIKADNIKQDASKKEVRFMDQLNAPEKFTIKTGFSEKPAMNQLLHKKLSQRTEMKPQSSALTRRDLRVPLRVEEVTNMDNFVHKKISSSYVLIARLKKLTWGLNWLWPQYHMKDEKSDIHILSAKKKMGNTTSNYYISRNQKQIDVQNDKYMGKLRGNFLGSCFSIFNKGVNPESVENAQKKDQNVRKLLANVVYESQFANSNPKSIKVYMIKPQYTYYDLQGTSVKSEQKSLQKLYQIGQNKTKISLFINRKATYNKKLNRFVLNFDGRIKMPSTKNLILQDSQTKKQVMMFGKVQSDEYVLHMSSPLTPHIGLAIALAELDSKIICD